MNTVIIKRGEVLVVENAVYMPIYRSDNGRQSTPGCPSARLGCIPADWAAADTIGPRWTHQEAHT